MTFPLAGTDLRCEAAHLVEHLVHLRHHVFPIDDDAFALGGTERDMQYGAVLGDIDLSTAEHGLGTALQINLFGQRDEQL